MNEITTIRVTKKTKSKLAELGNKSETYEDILNKMVDFYIQQNNKKVEE